MTNRLRVNPFAGAWLALLLAIACPASADFGDYRGHAVEGQSVVVTTTMGELTLTALNASSFEAHYREDGIRQLPSFAKAGEPAPVATVVNDGADSIAVAIDGLTAVISKRPVSIAYSRDGAPLVAEEHGYFALETLRGFRFTLDDDEKILGGGQRVLGMDRRGERMPLYNRAHYGYSTESRQMYYSLPAILSSKRYVIAFDNTASGWLDIASTEKNVLQFEAVAGRTSYIISAGDTYPQLIEAFTGVTGRQPLPPRWAFGNFASRFGYRTEKETRDVVRRFQRADVPLDAIILDIYWFGPDIQGHMGKLDWDRNAFPTPEDMISDFADDGIRTIAITEPFILSTSERWQDAVDKAALALNVAGVPKTFDFYFGNTGLVDVFNENARDWFWQPYRMLFEQGTAATWGDLGEPEVHPGDALHRLSDAGIVASGDEIHNAYGHRWAQMIYDKQVEEYPDVRPVVLMRSGFLGTQRYGMLPWTGDVDRSWGGLKPQVELALQMGLFGLGYTHSDLGGFAGGETFDSELYTRWLQYGVFQPVYRPHAQEHIAPEPVFHDRTTLKRARDAIRLRYRLLPYLYTLAWENTTTGMPLMRPLFFEDENNPALIDDSSAYLWGDAFLVAPVTDPGVDRVSVNLPAGRWFDFWNDTAYDGGASVNVPVTAETIPVLVRAGSFVPMTSVVNNTDDYSSESLELHYYADPTVPTSSGHLYEDDGHSRTSLDDGAYELLRFYAARNGDSLRFTLDREGADYDGRPERRDITLVIHNWTEPARSIIVNGQELPVVRKLPKSGAGAAIDAASRELRVRFSWHQSRVVVAVNQPQQSAMAGKPVVYQVFTRLFGNKEATNKPWGTIEENGVGKFAHFTDAALEGIAELGVSHIWYTGVPHHAVIRDYTNIGISEDDPDVVKGRAGSPYAVKDYYSVNPDLAVNPENRLAEFEALIERTHRHGMKVIIDIVPNHVARRYESIARPDGIDNFGANDDTSVEWALDNNFYYVVGQDFSVPASPEGYAPLGGDPHPLADGKFAESPAKWTGNGARAPRPDFNDWYETVKVNYGVRPDGSYAFERLPYGADTWSIDEHRGFWSGKDVPDSWRKFRDIALYWSALGVDGFRYDMAEMVPIEFWSYLNSSIKAVDPDAFLLAEVYNPSLYRDYLILGRMDYLYDKVGFYDTLKSIMQGRQSAATLADVHAEVLDIDEHMLHFLENHDEQRIASEPFAGDADAGRPAMAVSALISRSPTMIYFGQAVGEPGDGDAGFGTSSRTTIFDYWGVPAHQRWMNGGKFDGGALADDEKALRDFYVRVLNISATNAAMQGDYRPLDVVSVSDNATDDRVFAFARWQHDERLIVAASFDDGASRNVRVDLPGDVIQEMGLADGRYTLTELLYGDDDAHLVVDGGNGQVFLELDALESVVLRIGNANIIRHADFPSEHVEPRNIDVWVPKNYFETNDDMQVVYAHDGQNLYNPSFVWNNEDWDIDGVLQRLIDNGEVDDTIVVGIWNTPLRRREYLPADMFDVVSPQARGTIAEVMGGEPLSKKYLRFLVEELKPHIDAEYRTKPGRDDTYLMGSSMGGLISLYAVLEYPQVFSGAACLSTHWPLSLATNDIASTEAFIEYLRAAIPPPGEHRFYFDFGTEELDGQYEPHQRLVDRGFLDLGYDGEDDYRSLKFDGAGHSEPWWRARLDVPLRFILD